MSAPVRIEAVAWTDPRYATLARVLGLADADHALIKVAKIWAWQTKNYTPESPTYCVDEDTIESFLGAGGAAALVRAKLADETPDGFRIHGSEGRIEWSFELAEQRVRAGHARADKAARDSRGRLVKRSNCNAHDSHPAGAGAAGQRMTSERSSESPAQSSAPIPSPSPTQENTEALSPARAGAPPAGTAALGSSTGWHRRQAWWTAMLEADQRLRAAGIEPNAPALARSPAGEVEKAMAACERQFADGYGAEQVDAKMRHVVAVAEAEARRAQHRRWFKPALIWNPAKAARAADSSLDEASRDPEPTPPRGGPPRAGPSGSAARAPYGQSAMEAQLERVRRLEAEEAQGGDL